MPGRVSGGFDGGKRWSCSRLRARSYLRLSAQSTFKSSLSRYPFFPNSPFISAFVLVYCFSLTAEVCASAAFCPNHTMALQISLESTGCEWAFVTVGGLAH